MTEWKAREKTGIVKLKYGGFTELAPKELNDEVESERKIGIVKLK